MVVPKWCEQRGTWSGPPRIPLRGPSSVLTLLDMALVRCSCLVELVTPEHRDQLARRAADVADVVVRVLDPACGYVVHRMGALLADVPGGA